MKPRVAAVFVAAALVSAVASAQPASLAARSATQLSGSVGHAYDRQLRVVVYDEWGAELPDVVVSFTAPVSGASASFSPSPAVTDESGEASVTPIANGTIGVYSVTAAVAGVAQTVTFTLFNVAEGFRPGEQLASVFAADEKGKIRNLRDFLDGGRSYALIEVCSFCPACEDSERAAPIGIARLADRKIPVNLVPVLMFGFPAPGTQTDAQFWKSHLELKGPVLHPSGSMTSDIFRAAEFIIGLPALDFPTTLLVAPDGTIVDRFRAAMTASALEARVLRAVLAEHPVHEATAADVVVTMDRTSLRGTAAPTLTGPLGSVRFEAHFTQLITEDIELRFDAAHPLPDVVHVEVSPLWSDGVQRYQRAPLYVNYLSEFEGTPLDLRGWSDAEVLVSRRNGTFVLDVDVKQARVAIAAQLVQYVNEGYLTQAQADAVVRDLNGLYFELELDVDVRLRGNAR